MEEERKVWSFQDLTEDVLSSVLSQLCGYSIVASKRISVQFGIASCRAKKSWSTKKKKISVSSPGCNSPTNMTRGTKINFLHLSYFLPSLPNVHRVQILDDRYFVPESVHNITISLLIDFALASDRHFVIEVENDRVYYIFLELLSFYPISQQKSVKELFSFDFMLTGELAARFYSDSFPLLPFTVTVRTDQSFKKVEHLKQSSLMDKVVEMSLTSLQLFTMMSDHKGKNLHVTLTSVDFANHLPYDRIRKAGITVDHIKLDKLRSINNLRLINCVTSNLKVKELTIRNIDIRRNTFLPAMFSTVNLSETEKVSLFRNRVMFFHYNKGNVRIQLSRHKCLQVLEQPNSLKRNINVVECGVDFSTEIHCTRSKKLKWTYVPLDTAKKPMLCM